MSVDAGSLAIAIPAALAGAASFGLASAAQALATKQISSFHTLDPTLIRELLHRPMWILGVVATVAGLGLQLVALAFAPLIVVQPLLVTAVVFGAMFAALMRHRRLDRVIVAGALICSFGLAAFLVVARPHGQAATLPGIEQLLPLAAALVAVTALGLAAGALNRGSVGVVGLAIATGVFYGVTAGLLKVVAAQLRTSPWEPLRHWALYTACVTGPIGFLLSQDTFQRGRLVAPALSVITTVDPLVGVAIGVWWLGEQVATSAPALAGEAVAAIVIVFGIILLTSRAAQLPSEQGGEKSHNMPKRQHQGWVT